MGGKSLKIKPIYIITDNLRRKCLPFTAQGFVVNTKRFSEDLAVGR